MSRRKCLIACGLLACCLTGCGIAGRWELCGMNPESARRGFEFGSIVLRGDGTYAASIDEGKGRRETTGRYTFDSSAERITFTSDAGAARTYRAHLAHGGNELHIFDGGDKPAWSAALHRR